MLKLSIFTLNNIDPFLEEVEKAASARLQEVGLAEFEKEIINLDQYYNKNIAQYLSLFSDIKTMGETLKFREKALMQVCLTYVNALTESQAFKNFISAHVFSIIKNCQDYDDFMELLADYDNSPSEFCINHRPNYPIPQNLNEWVDRTETGYEIIDVLDEYFLNVFETGCEIF